jgi:hypothetical protein
MKYDFEAAFGRAIEPVGDRAFRALVKTVVDGLPRGLIGASMWESELISRQPTESEAHAAAYVARLIREEAAGAIARLFSDASFRAALKRDMQTGHARGMASNRKKRRSSLFMAAIQAAPQKSTKEILKELEGENKILDAGDVYLIVDDGTNRDSWERVAKTTLDSKFSRLRNM